MGTTEEMPLIHDEPLDFLSRNGSTSRCRVRVCTPPDAAQESGYVVILTDDAGACGTSITNAAEQIGAEACARYHLPAGHDGNGHEQTFARVRFQIPTAAGEIFDYIHQNSLGRPEWSYIDQQSVEMLIGEPLP